ncbi:MAG: AMP-binding protein [Desulfomonile tiedjei]|nr:AMP-binding protein [Desulfomonile tiedjei]
MPIGWLLDRMASWEDVEAVIWRAEPVSYEQLLGRARQWRVRLAEDGVGEGHIVALEGGLSPDICALLIALIQHRAVIVPLGPVSDRNRFDFLQIAQGQHVYAFDAGGAVKVSHRPCSPPTGLLRELIARGEPGLVLFTSGSSGNPKAVVHSLERLLWKFQKPRARLRTAGLFRLDHIAGFDSIFYALSSGGTLIVVENYQPDEMCRAIEHHAANHLTATPTFLRLLLGSGACWRHDLSSLQLVTYGSEVMPEATLHVLRKAMPNARFIQKYGLTELGSPRSRSKDSDSAWIKIVDGDFEARVVNGTLQIRTRSSMLGYLNAPDPFTADGWFDTGDAVETDGEYIRILGRKSEVINVGGEKVYPAEVENVLLEMPNVKDVIVRGEPNQILGNIVSAAVSVLEPETAESLGSRMRKFCKGRLARYKIPVKVEVVTDAQYGDRFKKQRAQKG